MRANALFAALIAAISLSACADQPREPLAKRLDGKTPEERREILRLACLSEAEWDLNRATARQPFSLQHSFRDSNTTVETTHLKHLCSTLSAVSSLSTQSSVEKQKRRQAAENCAREILEHIDEQDPASVAHMSRLRKICEETTGETVF